MLRAKEARILTKKTHSSNLERATAWAIGEWECIEKYIRKASEEGEYSTDYWWSKALLTEANLTQEDAMKGLIEVCSKLGYHTNYIFNHEQNGLTVFKMFIDWHEEEEENE